MGGSSSSFFIIIYIFIGFGFGLLGMKTELSDLSDNDQVELLVSFYF